VTRIYDLLARVYDTPSHTQVTEAFEQAIRPYVAPLPPGSAVLDLACGTGTLARALGEKSRTVIGVDSSRKMLAIARDRCHHVATRVRFVRGDLTAFRVPETCLLACASADVFNHVLTIAPLRRMFRNTFRNLAPGGRFVFDALNRFCFEHYWADRDYYTESDSGDLMQECTWNPRRRIGTARMIGFVRETDGRYARVECDLLERHWSNAELRDALRGAGFSRVKRTPWSPWPDQHLEPALERNLWTAVKASPRGA